MTLDEKLDLLGGVDGFIRDAAPEFLPVLNGRWPIGVRN